MKIISHGTPILIYIIISKKISAGLGALKRISPIITLKPNWLCTKLWFYHTNLATWTPRGAILEKHYLILDYKNYKIELLEILLFQIMKYDLHSDLLDEFGCLNLEKRRTNKLSIFLLYIWERYLIIHQVYTSSASAAMLKRERCQPCKQCQNPMHFIHYL